MTKEDALKQIREWDFLNDEERAALETLIPELTESEDERIRKWILEKVHGYADSGIPCSDEIQMANKALAWLEEQKDMNCLACDQHLKGYIAGRKATKEEKQKEQKPVDISENNDSDANGHLTGKILVEYGAHAKVRDGKRHCEMDWKEFQRLAHYFYELGKAEPKPAEWSEEDVKMRNLIVAIFEVNHPNGFFKANELGTTDMRGVHTEEIISWLKSLRPSWKPSEEQMEALRRAVNKLAKSDVADSVRLSIMYDNLKKLM